MNEALFKKYGIDPGLPTEQILEQLQSKNLELLERMGSCSDNARLAQLQTDQQEVEDAISTLSSAVSLDRQVAKKAAQPSPTAAADPLQAALRDYQAGRTNAALPVLKAHADQGDPLCCILTANILLNQNSHAQEAKEYLYTAATAGNGAASLKLAQVYQKEHVTPSAIKWGKLALEQKEKGSGRFLAPLYLQNNQPDQAAEAYIGELALVSQYDLYLLTHDIVALLNKNRLSPAADKRLRAETLAKIQNDSRCMGYWQEQMKTQKPGRSIQRSLNVKRLFSPIAVAFAAATTGISFYLINYFGEQTDFAVDVSWPAGVIPAGFIVVLTLCRFLFPKGGDRRRILVLGVIKAAAALILFPMVFSFAFDSPRRFREMAVWLALAVQLFGGMFLMR